MSSLAKVLDPAFQGAGQRVGTEIWRIENFQPVSLPKSEHGKFYSGDSYIVLQTTSGKGGAYLYDMHFWLGKDTSQDEAGTAAIKTVELDASLGGRAVQHREIQGHESDKFLSYFKPCIIPLEGGVASGFKKPEEEEFETRLYVCKGKRVVRLKQVPFVRSSLNHDDVFILDTQNKIYQFNGANSNIQERAKALEVIQFLKEKYHDGTCDVAIVDDGKLDTESDSGEFWVLFGGFAPIGKKVTSDDDAVPEATPAKLYSIADGEVKAVEGELSKSLLENNRCFLLDCGDEIFVWVGRVTQVDERKVASQAAEDFLSSQNRPKATRITRIIQGYETHAFKSKFESWPSGSAAPAEEGRGKVAALLKQQGGGVKGMTKGTPVNEEVPPLLEGGGKIASILPGGNKYREGGLEFRESKNLREMECCKRANRSDVHLSRDEEAKVEEQTREYFDGIAPKRHSKPQRSDYSSNYVDALSSDDADNPHPIPELVEFKRLEHNTQKLMYNGSQVEDEFVETAYYKDLNCTDKQHHQTGTGFIKIGNASDESFSIAPDTSTGRHASCMGNPATNDWIPSAPETVSLASDKPNRSDN